MMMQPTVKETWNESDWFERGLLIVFAVGIAVNIAVWNDWDWAIIGFMLLLWQWSDMRKDVELNRWRNYSVNADSATIHYNVADLEAAYRKAQEIEKRRGMGDSGR